MDSNLWSDVRPAYVQVINLTYPFDSLRVKAK